MLGRFREDRDVYALAGRPHPDRESGCAVARCKAILTHERLLEILSNVLLGGITDMATSEEVRDLTLGDCARSHLHARYE